MVLRLRKPAPGNWVQAKCRSIDIKEDDVFFSNDETDQFEATEYCNGTLDGIKCPVRDQCLIFALHNSVEYGVYGGMTPLARKALRKKYPFKQGIPNPRWKWVPEEKALEGLSEKDISELRRSFIDY